MLKIKTKLGCTFCDVLKFHLEQEGIEYVEEKTKLVAPVILLDDKVVYAGLPPLKELQAFINTLK